MFRGRRSRKGRGSIHRRQIRRRGQTLAPQSVRKLAIPRFIPEVQQVAKSTRWIRLNLTKPATGDWFVRAGNIATALFGSCISGSFCYLRRLRLWLEDSDSNSRMTVDVYASPLYSGTPSNIDATIRYRALSTNGSRNTCVSVQLTEHWRITSVASNNQALLLNIVDASGPVGPESHAYLDVFVDVIERNPATTTFVGDQLQSDEFEVVQSTDNLSI